MRIDIACRLTDTQLLAAVRRLADDTREITAVLVAHLVELENRCLHLSLGYSSMFTYCTEVLRLSEQAAYNRIEAARLARRFPRVLDLLADGSLALSTVRLLAPHLTGENCRELLAAASGKSKREVEEVLACVAPRPDVPAAVRKLPTSAPLWLDAGVAGSSGSAGQMGGFVGLVAPMPRAARPVVVPLAPERYQFTFTGDRETREMLEMAKDVLRHTLPDGDTAAVIKLALKALLEEQARRRFAATEQPRASRGGPSGARSRHIPAAVKRVVWIRERGQCAFVGSGGRRCSERGAQEFAHVSVSYAKGGAATPENIQLRCRAHNAHEAAVEFGERRPGGEWDVRDAAMAALRAPTRPGASSPTAPSSCPG